MIVVESNHVGAHLITKPAAHIGFVLEAACAEQEGSRWQNSYAEIVRFLCSCVMCLVSY